MNPLHRTTTWLLIPLLTVLAAAAARSQNPSPQAFPQRPSAAVAAVLGTNPSTPAEWARAASILAGFDRPDLARNLLRKIIAAKLTEDQLAALAQQYGTPMFTEMAGREDLLPEANLLCDAILQALGSKLQEPKRIAEMVEQLQDPSIDVRTAALEGLIAAPTAAIGPLVRVLADSDGAKQHPYAREVLIRIGRPAVDPLLGILDSADPKLTFQAILVLREMKALKATSYLLEPCTSATSDARVRAAAGATLARLVGHVPTTGEAIRLLRRRAEEQLDRELATAGTADAAVKVWSWNDQQRQCESKTVSAAQAARITAARFARDAYSLAPDDPSVRMLYITTMLEAAAYEIGLDKSPEQGEGTAAARASAFDVAVIEDALQYAMAGNHTAAATAAALILGRKGTAEALLHRGAQPAPLVRAARHGDRRLRAAALDAVVRLQPVQRYPGSSYISQALGFAAVSRGAPRALVAGPVTEASRQLGGMLAGMGYEVDTASTGRELLRLATASPDYELALIDVSIDRLPADLLLQQLRNDWRTADLRIGLIARSGHLGRARRIADRDPLAIAFSRPHGIEALQWQLEQLSGLAPQRFVGHEERMRQAGDALARLAELGEASTELYDLRRLEKPLLGTLYVPQLSAKAAAVLGGLGTPGSQRALVELAGRWSQPIEIRQAAAGAFRRSIEKYGLLLTTAQISRQYERYNQSGTLDADSQQVLAFVLDCIEAPTQVVKATAEPQK